MNTTKLEPEHKVEDLESYRLQMRLDARKKQIDALASPNDAESLQRLWLSAVTYCQTIFFSLTEADPTIEQVESDIPELTIIARVGNSYGVSVPANDESLGRFLQLYGNLPDPVPEDMSALQREVEEKLSKGFSAE